MHAPSPMVILTEALNTATVSGTMERFKPEQGFVRSIFENKASAPEGPL
jgi:hypothetical protein